MVSKSSGRLDTAANNVQLSGKVREFHIILLERLVLGIANIDEEGEVYIRQTKTLSASENPWEGQRQRQHRERTCLSDRGEFRSPPPRQLFLQVRKEFL